MRGLAYLKMTILDLIGKCQHAKPRVLCCTGCCGWTPQTPQESDLLNLVPQKPSLAARSLQGLDLAIDDKTPGLLLVENSLPFTTRSGISKSSPSLQQHAANDTAFTISEATEDTDSPQQQQRITHTISTESGATGDSPQQQRVEWDSGPKLKVSLPFNIKSRLKKKQHKENQNCTMQFLQRIDNFRVELKGERSRIAIDSDQVDGEEQPLMFIPGRILHLEEGPEYATKT